MHILLLFVGWLKNSSFEFYTLYPWTGMLDTTCFCCKKTKQTKQRYFQRKTFVYNCVQYTLGLYTIHAQCSRFEIAVVQGARPICRSVRHHIWICILLTPPHGSFMVREISISNIFHFIWSHGWISELLTSEITTGGQFWGGQLWVSPSSELPTLITIFLICWYDPPIGQASTSDHVTTLIWWDIFWFCEEDCLVFVQFAF